MFYHKFHDADNIFLKKNLPQSDYAVAYGNYSIIIKSPEFAGYLKDPDKKPLMTKKLQELQINIDMLKLLSEYGKSVCVVNGTKNYAGIAVFSLK